MLEALGMTYLGGVVLAWLVQRQAVWRGLYRGAWRAELHLALWWPVVIGVALWSWAYDDVEAAIQAAQRRDTGR